MESHFVQYNKVFLSQGLLMYRDLFQYGPGKCPLYQDVVRNSGGGGGLGVNSNKLAY